MEKTFDAKGMDCPLPLINTKKIIATLDSGDEYEMAFTCPEATEAVPNWAAENGHEVLNLEETGDSEWVIRIRKA